MASIGSGSNNTTPSSASVRRSTRESRPSSLRRQDEWQLDKKAKTDKFSPSTSEISPGRVSRRSKDGHSPGSILSNKSGIRKLSPSKPETSPRRTRGNDSTLRHSPKAEYQLPRRTRNGGSNLYNEESEEVTDDDPEDVDSPFYPRRDGNGPHHVRFSPNAKPSATANTNSSPFGRKTRSSRRGLSSYIQSLPSEDEQSEFNRHYKYVKSDRCGFNII